ncbi:MAG: hypothetical protein ACI8WL_001780 [Polaribacter sp.]
MADKVDDFAYEVRWYNARQNRITP